MSILYATPDELAHYIEPDEAEPAKIPNATVLLRKASGLVQTAIQGHVYRTDASGKPVHQATLDAVRDATCEYASALHFAGIDPRRGAEQAKREVASKGAEGVNVSYVANSARDLAQARLAQGDELTPEAWGILERAGLISNRVQTSPYQGGRAYELTPTSPFVLGDATLGS